MRALCWGDEKDAPSAFEVVKYHLRKKNLTAPLHMLNRGYGRPKETVALEGGGTIMPVLMPPKLADRFEEVTGKKRRRLDEPPPEAGHQT